jgi:hypothetical protein
LSIMITSNLWFSYCKDQCSDESTHWGASSCCLVWKILGLGLEHCWFPLDQLAWNVLAGDLPSMVTTRRSKSYSSRTPCTFIGTGGHCAVSW